MEELKPCPFCGNEAHVVERVVSERVVHAVECMAIQCCAMTQDFLRPESAMRSWNARIDTGTQPNLGCATTRQLLDEICARIEMDGRMGYRTVDTTD